MLATSSSFLPSGAGAAAFRDAVKQGLAHWVPAAIQAAAARLAQPSLRHAVAGDRHATAEVLSVLQARQREAAAAFDAALRSELDTPQPLAAPPAAPRQKLELTLLDEDYIDEEIEVARIVQSIESQAEWELSQLAALCSGLERRDAISPDANPLQPSAVARAMRRALVGFELAKPARLLLLRELAAATGARLREVYADQAALLQEWGVAPLGFTVRPTPTPRASAGIRQAVQQALAPRGARAPAPAAEHGALARLVEWARRDVRASMPGGDAAAAAGPVRLLEVARPADGDTPLDATAAVHVMERLFALLSEQDSLSRRVRGLVRRLDAPAREIAANDPELWRSLKHPWWQLLDRVVSAGSVQDEVDTSRPGALGASLERVVEKLERVPRPDAAQCRQALAEVDFVVTGLLDERSANVAPEAAALQQRLDRETVEQRLREQIIQQLRATPAPAGLRQFLVGPWAIALADAAVRHGEQSAPLQRRALLVDALIEACENPAAPPDSARIEALLGEARIGLGDAEFAASRTEAELADLAAILRRPPPPETKVPELAVEPLPVGQVLSLHDGLPTVPIDTVEGGVTGGAAQDRQAWLERLEPGDYCRLFLLDRWMTTQLTWRSTNRGMFVFTSRHAGRVHSLTRRALEKLRAAGLAATIEHGQLLAQAMDTLVEDTGSH